MKIIKNKYQYYEADQKPTKEELATYYRDKYYQNPKGSYERTYTSEEKRYFSNKMEQKFAIIQREGVTNGSVLDIGAGEGWALNFFLHKGFAVRGIDYSIYGCAKHNPDCTQFLIAGDMYEKLQEEIQAKQKYDIVILDNVLEHAVDPLKLLTTIQSIKKENGILIIDVPNDFSPIQQHLIEHNHVNTEFWVDPPEHLSYFTMNGLRDLCATAEFTYITAITDFPIDLFLFNSNTNYVTNPAVGKSCHAARIEIENLLHSISTEKTNELYRAMAGLGIGRVLTMFVK